MIKRASVWINWCPVGALFILDWRVCVCDIHEHRTKPEDHGRWPVLYSHGCHQRLWRSHGHFYLSRESWQKKKKILKDSTLTLLQIPFLFFWRWVWSFSAGCLRMSPLSLEHNCLWCCAVCVHSGSLSWFHRWGRWYGRSWKGSRRFSWLVLWAVMPITE